MTLAVPTSYSGGTTISGGMLQVGNGGTSGSLLGNVTDNALLAFDLADPSYTFTGNIGGSGSIEQIGGGVLILAGTNSYGGATTVASGTLQFATSAALPPTSPLSVSSGATINLNGVNVTASAIGGSGIVALGTATLTLTDTTTTLLTAQVVGAGSLIKNGPGTLVLSASQGYTGGTTISGGALQIGNGVAAGSLLGNLLDNGQLLFDRTGTSSFGGSITGAGSLATIGVGLLTLGASNGYSGGTTVTAGTLQLGAVGAYPTATPLTVAAGATFNLNGFACTISGIGGSGAVTLGNTTLTMSAGQSGERHGHDQRQRRHRQDRQRRPDDRFGQQLPWPHDFPGRPPDHDQRRADLRLRRGHGRHVAVGQCPLQLGHEIHPGPGGR